jgi:competence protein ComEC
MTRMLFNSISVVETLPVYALAFLSGIASLQCFRFLPDALWAAFLPIFLFISVFNRVYRLPSIFLAGFLWALLHAHHYFNHVLPEEMTGQTIAVDGHINGIPKSDGRVQRFLFKITSFDQKYTGFYPETLKLSWYGHHGKLKAGQHWQLMVRLKPPHGFMNPGGFDYERWLYQERIHATGYVQKHSSNRLKSGSPVYSINRIRQSTLDYVTSYTSRFTGLIAALAVGYKGGISAEQWQVLTRTGTNHLMAISGLHVGLVAAWIFWLARRVAPVIILKRLPGTQFAALISLIVAGFYALLAGFAIPTQRAMAMLCVVLVALMFRKQVRPLNSLCWALIVVLVFDPVSVLALGFWFSFIAVAVIAYSFSGRLCRARGWMQWGRLQWVIALALFPVSLFLFNQTSLIAPLANLLFVPLATVVVVPLILLASLSLLFSTDLAQWLYQLTETVFELSWPMLQWFSKHDLSIWQQAQPPILYMLLAILGVALLLAPKGLSHRWLGMIMLLPCLLYQAELPEDGEVWVDTLDVGQGLAMVIQTHHHILVYDTGPRFSDNFDTGERVILPYLKQKGIKKLDKLIISHGDNDHIGGAQSLLNQLAINELLGQGIKRLDHVHKVSCSRGQKWRWDQVDFEILHPDKDYKKSNNQSCVLKISNGKANVLITADIESKIEAEMIKFHTEKLKSDVMIIPHHGSKTSSSINFINAVKPDYAIVSSGYKNKFKHPRPEVIRRYQSSGIKTYNTAELGTVLLKLNKTVGIRPPASYRTKASHYWNHGHL